MFSFIQGYPGDQSFDLALVVILAVTLASSLAWLISRRLSRQAAVRHLVLFSALIGCLASPAVAWIYAASGLTLISIPILRVNEDSVESGTRQLEPALVERSSRPWTNVPPPITGGAPVAVSLPSQDNITSTVTGQVPGPFISSAPQVERTAGPTGALASFRAIAAGVMLLWAVGSLLMLARLALNCWRVVRLRRSSQPLQRESYQSLLREIAAGLGLRQTPQLLASNRAIIPMAIGLGRRAVILPERLLGTIGDHELQDVLVHELAHLRRGDQWVVLLQELAGALYWPIVSVHALNRELLWAREELCDNVVLADREAISYGQTLLHVAELLVEARTMGATVGIFSGRSQFERRISELIDPTRVTMTKISRKTICLVVLLVSLVVGVVPGMRFAASVKAQGPTPAAQKAPTLPDPKEPKIAERDSGEASATKRFTLKIVGPDGQPVPNAQVEIRPHPLPKPEEWRVTIGKLERHGTYGPIVTATETGSVAFDMPAKGWQHLNCNITKDGFAPYWAQWNPGSNSEPIPAEFTAQLDAGQSFGGVIVDESGRPIAGVEVHPSIKFKKRPGDLDVLHVGGHQTTDSEGRWQNKQVPASAKRLSIEAKHPDYAPQSASLSVPEFRLPANGIPVSRITMRSGVTLTGRVVDAQGTPIIGAWVRTAFVNDQREVRTDAEGRFRLPGCPSTRATLVASAKGHAPELKSLAISSDETVVDFQLPAPQTLRVKVVDAQGQPVPKTRIFFQQWRSNANRFELGMIHAYTNDEGVWEWRDAPADPIICDICPPDGVQLARREIQARQAEWLFTATPALKISGRVIDKQSRAPVPTFRVTPGRRYSSGVIWDRDDSFDAKAGIYEFRPYPSDDASQVVMIQADGYLAFISRDVLANEGSVTVDAELERGADITPRILTPDGAPAVNADVALGVQDAQIHLASGGFSEHGTYCERRTADADGRIRFPPQSGKYHLLVSHPSGFAHVIREPKQASETIKLQAWSRVEGVIKDGTKPLPNASIWLTVNSPLFLNHRREAGWPRISTDYRLQADNQGRFVLEGIIPGPGQVAHEVRFRILPNGFNTAMTHGKRVTFASGETSRVTIGGTGQSVVGQLQPPAGVEKVDWNTGLVKLSPSEADVARRANDVRCAAAINRDGSFRVSDVPSGDYELTVEVSTSDNTPLGHLTQTLTIPEFPNGRSDEALDVGTLKLVSMPVP